MAWQTPKTDWSSADGVRDSDLNRIEGNIQQLYHEASAREDKTIYVSPTGDDTTGNGSSSAPYATITKALSTISKNTNGKSVTIYVATGTYSDQVSIKGFDSPITLSGGYNATATITSLRIEHSHVILDGLHLITEAASSVTVTNGGRLIGSGRLTTNNGSIGMRVNSGGIVAVTTYSSNNSGTYAISADSCARVSIVNLAGSGNKDGILSQGGATVAITTNNLGLTGTLYTTYGGGRVRTGSLNSATS